MSEPTVDKEMARAVVQVLQVIENNDSIIQQQEATKQANQTHIDAQTHEIEDRDARIAAAVQELDRLQQATRKAREEFRTADIDYRARIVRAQEEFSDINGRIPRAQENLNRILSDTQEALRIRAAEKLGQLHVA